MLSIVVNTPTLILAAKRPRGARSPQEPITLTALRVPDRAAVPPTLSSDPQRRGSEPFRGARAPLEGLFLTVVGEAVSGCSQVGEWVSPDALSPQPLSPFPLQETEADPAFPIHSQGGRLLGRVSAEQPASQSEPFLPLHCDLSCSLCSWAPVNTLIFPPLHPTPSSIPSRVLP